MTVFFFLISLPSLNRLNPEAFLRLPGMFLRPSPYSAVDAVQVARRLGFNWRKGHVPIGLRFVLSLSVEPLFATVTTFIDPIERQQKRSPRAPHPTKDVLILTNPPFRPKTHFSCFSPTEGTVDYYPDEKVRVVLQ